VGVSIDKAKRLLRSIVNKGIGLFLCLLQAIGLGHIARRLRHIFVSEPLMAGSRNWTLN
jgi:hypothetical protein